MDKTKLQPPKGMRDFTPAEMEVRRRLVAAVEEIYRLYGYRPIDTPALENLEVLQGKGGGENEKLLYKVMKRGEELEQARGKEDAADLGLRFDLTVPLARYAANHAHEIGEGFRCYHLGPVWRADRPQKGRFREFWQCDIDVLHANHPWAYEAELLLATDRVLRRLDVGKFRIRVSDRRLVPLVLKASGIPEAEGNEFCLLVDKYGRELLHLRSGGVGTRTFPLKPEWNGPLDVLQAAQADPAFLSSKVPGAGAIVENLQALLSRVRGVHRDAPVEFDPFLIRGLNYYTGPVFEVNVVEGSLAASVAGGGRYDGLIEKLGGPPGTQAVGISLGFERILAILEEREQGRPNRAQAGRVLVASKGEGDEEGLLKLAEALRAAGIPAEVSFSRKDFGKRLKAAEEAGIEYAVTGGDPQGNLRVRVFSRREDVEMSLAELRDFLRAGAA